MKPRQTNIIRKPALQYRWDIINSLARKINAKRYLEIGIHFGHCFEKVAIANKTGIDPSPLGLWADDRRIVRKTSDEFFSNLPTMTKFDIVFIDGLHTHSQSWRDASNSFIHLADGGYIIMHDCSPIKEEHQYSEPWPNEVVWNGDVWKAVVDLRALGSFQVQTVNIDQGCAVIRKRQAGDPPHQPLPPYWRGADFNWLKKNRVRALNLVSPQQFNL